MDTNSEDAILAVFTWPNYLPNREPQPNGSKTSLQVWSNGRLEMTWSESVILPFISAEIRVLNLEYTSFKRHFISTIARL
jgi:hypothetical protein